jgi:hypothetical protein
MSVPSETTGPSRGIKSPAKTHRESPMRSRLASRRCTAGVGRFDDGELAEVFLDTVGGRAGSGEEISARRYAICRACAITRTVQSSERQKAECREHIFCSHDREPPLISLFYLPGRLSSYQVSRASPWCILRGFGPNCFVRLL